MAMQKAANVMATAISLDSDQASLLANSAAKEAKKEKEEQTQQLQMGKESEKKERRHTKSKNMYRIKTA